MVADDANDVPAGDPFDTVAAAEKPQ